MLIGNLSTDVLSPEREPEVKCSLCWLVFSLHRRLENSIFFGVRVLAYGRDGVKMRQKENIQLAVAVRGAQVP